MKKRRKRKQQQGVTREPIVVRRRPYRSGEAAGDVQPLKSDKVYRPAAKKEEGLTHNPFAALETAHDHC